MASDETGAAPVLDLAAMTDDQLYQRAHDASLPEADKRAAWEALVIRIKATRQRKQPKQRAWGRA